MPNENSKRVDVINRSYDSTTIKGKKGNSVTLLTQSGKIGKFSHELKTNNAYTNDRELKVDKKTGEVKQLTAEQRAFRAGYLSACKEASKIFKKKHPKTTRKTETVRDSNSIRFSKKTKNS